MQENVKDNKETDSQQVRTTLKSGDTEAKTRAKAPPVKAGEQVKLRINGNELAVAPGTTLLEAARSADIFIPTLCHHEALSNYGACRLCTVEVIKGRRSRMVASCIYPVEDGIEVLTESDRVVQHRRIMLELILARWPWVPEDLLKRYGVEKSRFEEDTNFCILCGLCVRYCTEVKKANVLGFVGRGVERQVVIYPELALKMCPTCDDGKMGCRSVCPTGTIPNEFAHTGPRYGKKLPLAYPVRTYQEDNVREIMKTVGDWRMPWVRNQASSDK